MRAKLPDKLYYGIGEVAEAFSVNTSLIRFWEKEFEELQPKKNAKGDRKFSKNDIASLELIYHLLKEKGYTIAGAKAYLKTNKKQTLDKMEMISKLEFVKNELIQIKNEL
ncbi:MAG: MerR family transcriptional regulator [Flavobacteriaceae bacterium]|nr:MerR family transcriptional regulator [Flavobacteriaceae bacterium]